MNHAEVRAIRGALSRAAFARLLGVTTLTVLRWELPEDSKEARRPRAKMIEALRRLAAEGVGNRAVASESEPDEDDDASEPVAPSAAPLASAVTAVAATPTGDERRVLPLLEQLSDEHWRKAEDELLTLLSSSELETADGRTLATLGLVQVQILARMDVRGALTVLLPILDDAERGLLPGAVAARAHVVATMVFGAPDSRTFDLGRVNAHAARAESLLAADDDDLRVLSATSCIAAARFLGPEVTLHAYQQYRECLEHARSPLARLLADGLAGLVATVRGDAQASALHGGRALALAERFGFWGLVMGILSDYATRALRGTALPDEVLKTVAHARQLSLDASLAPTEGFIRLLACECESLARLGRYDEAHRTALEALALAKRGGLARYALTIPVSRVLLHTGRVDELKALAASFAQEGAGTQRFSSELHTTYLRALLLNLDGDYAGAAQLCEAVCSAPETTPGLDYLVQIAYFELCTSYAMAGNAPASLQGLRRWDALLEQRPSVWHSTMRRRAESLALMVTGRFDDARQRIESARATFTLLGDLVQSALEDAGLAMIATATGAPSAPEAAAAAFTRLEAFGVDTAFLKRRSGVITAPLVASWSEQTMAEKLLIAIDRLSVKGLDAAALGRELAAVLATLFPGREVVLGGTELAAGSAIVETQVEGDRLLFGVLGDADPEQRAGLAVLASFISRRPASTPGLVEPETSLDGVLPAFIAASAATRQLKSEIVRLSRSHASILISGESGSGKEVVARAVHDVSLRAGRSYVAFNCASVPRDLFESQLFGYRKGAFTGAVSDSPGVVRAADGGTLFLDEIGELPLEVQPKLLRFLENGEVFPLGEQKPRRVDVRVVAATHRDLGRLVREGRFREDLYYRLNVVPISVPPLRERKEDITALARLFITRLSTDSDITPKLGADAVSALQAHTWPGNVRELRNVVERAMAYAPVPSVLSAEHLRIARS